MPGTITGPPPPRRVRHEVRDGVMVMAFSALASCCFAGALLLVARVTLGTGN